MPRKAKSQESDSEKVLSTEAAAPKKRGRKPKAASTTVTTNEEVKPVKTRRKKLVDPEEIIRKILNQPEPEAVQEELQQEVKEIQQASYDLPKVINVPEPEPEHEEPESCEPEPEPEPEIEIESEPEQGIRTHAYGSKGSREMMQHPKPKSYQKTLDFSDLRECFPLTAMYICHHHRSADLDSETAMLYGA